MRAVEYVALHGRRGRRRPGIDSHIRTSYVTPETQPDGHLHVGHDGAAQGNQQQPFEALRRRVSACPTSLGLGADDVGYTCMPLFHSNSMFIGFMPAFWVGGAVGHARALQRQQLRARRLPVRRHLLELRRRARALRAARNSRSSTAATSSGFAARGDEPSDNRFRYAVGNGASPPDIDKFIDWMGLEDMFELYGSTEAAIATYRRKGDPRGSVGEDHRSRGANSRRARR